MNRFAIALSLFVTLPSVAATPPQTLTCNLPATPERPANHLTFSLDEANRTASLLPRTGKPETWKAVFTPQRVTWSIDVPYGSLTRTVDRKNLTFVEVLTVQGKTTSQPGQCALAGKPPA